MSICPCILIVDDEKNSREGLRAALEAQDYDIVTASDGLEALQLYRQEKPDLVLADIRMPGLSGLELLEKVKALNPRALVILMTAYGSVDDAVRAMKSGAFHYITKPLNLEEVEFLVKKALAQSNLEEEVLELREASGGAGDYRDILAESPKMRQLLETVDKVAKTGATVLIEGESGTGKELLARRIHAQSPRKARPFLAVHCAALAETLLASELFGHERGAFTGAAERKVGRFERADKGTLFLDEIGEISPDTQVKLLRVLQSGEFERVGGVKLLRSDVRLVCATNKNLLSELKAGRFREDLYYRINVISIKVPPLRERPEDITPLTEAFIPHYSLLNGKKMTGISPEATAALKGYSWPGNVRELKNILERMVVLSNTEVLDLANVPEDIRAAAHLSPITTPVAALASFGSSLPDKLSDVEKVHIRRIMLAVKGNKSLAAKRLGISRRTLYRKIEEYRLEDPN